jgi:PIN domain nuclease of toxin-antitoxin system
LRLLLDTATFIWAAISPERISRTAVNAMAEDGAVREISTLSLSEIAIKQAEGKLNLSREDVKIAIDDLRLEVLPYSSTHAYRLFELPLHPADPFDRMLIAQAVAEGIPIVTSDEKFNLYRELKVIW